MVELGRQRGRRRRYRVRPGPPGGDQGLARAARQSRVRFRYQCCSRIPFQFIGFGNLLDRRQVPQSRMSMRFWSMSRRWHGQRSRSRTTPRYSCNVNWLPGVPTI